MGKVDRLGWAAQSTYLIGDRLVGIRTNTHEADELVRTALCAHLVEEAPEIPASYSVQVNAPDGRIRPKHVLFRAGSAVVRSREVGRLLVSLALQLDQYTNSWLHRCLGLKTSGAITSSGEVVLFPGRPTRLRDLDGRLGRHGIRVLDVWSTPVSLGRPVVDLRFHGVDLDMTQIEAQGSWLAGHTYPVRAWLFRRQPPTRAQAVATAFRLVEDDTSSHAQRRLECLANVMKKASVVEQPRGDDASTALLDFLISENSVV